MVGARQGIGWHVLPRRCIASVLVLLTSLLTSPAGIAGPAAGSRPHVRLVLPESLEPERAAYDADIAVAIKRVEEFFRVAGFPVPDGGLIDSATVFERTDEARAYLAKEAGVPVESVPATFSGTVDGRRMFLVSRVAYRRTWEALYRDWAWSDMEYRRLVVHELAHRAHEAVATSYWGSADAMGPSWFFEGLAVVCAGQFDDGGQPMTREELEAAVGSGRTPHLSYPLYGRIVRSLAHDVGWHALLSGAARPGFPDTLWGRSRRQRRTDSKAGLWRKPHPWRRERETVAENLLVLSRGERAQPRVRVERELVRRATGATLYILDEPTTGLHFDHTKKLLAVLHTLVGRGNTAVVIEHHLDVIKTADHVIDLGPEGGDAGGEIVAQGTPEQVALVRASYTGHYLAPLLGIPAAKAS